MKVQNAVATCCLLVMSFSFVSNGATAEDLSIRKINPFAKQKVRQTSNTNKSKVTNAEDNEASTKKVKTFSTAHIKPSFTRLGQGTVAAFSKTKRVLAEDIKWPKLTRARVKQPEDLVSDAKKQPKVKPQLSRKVKRAAANE